MLTHAPGEVPWPLRFDLLEPLSRLARVGRLVRDLHDALATFTPPPDARCNALIPADRHELIVHHDLLGVEPWVTHWRTGHGEAWRADAEYTEQHTDRWLTALLG
ncbi:hypothetical protein [Micromonospora sp. RP3T]|uniref:hypothetical protein n=1 Tax=Micromonospora sp. RP3T TaxID=2135446 RepID=UPI003D746082